MLCLAHGFFIARTFAVLPNKIFQGIRIGLRPDHAAGKASIALRAELRALFQGGRQKAEVVGSENDVREILLAGPSDFSLRDLCPTAFEALQHVRSANS